ncbi:Phosphatidylinositol 4-kinase beta 1 [Apostasia shenzhenica]|uniref:1-phosphatidylinositol 4-kinase n=1 Tax=Apostasia shenzhenica TaxID=1088818 RepID=A0A2I0AG64_9ASPA|nr:Phosphatidylinositol 4-kinase beta 1 [Apostasia shenzhenica]
MDSGLSFCDISRQIGPKGAIKSFYVSWQPSDRKQTANSSLTRSMEAVSKDRQSESVGRTATGSRSSSRDVRHSDGGLMMVRLLGFPRFGGDDTPREITRPSLVLGEGGSGENGWLIRFFDSAFFCEWIAVSYLYKHDHPGVRDYLCNRMYTLPLTGLESYLFQICYMLVHKPSPSLDKFVIDTCSKSLRIALKVHWFLIAELEDSEDSEGISRIQEKCQIASTLMGDWPPLIRTPPGSSGTPSSPKGNPMLNRLLSSKQRLLSLASSPPVGSNSSIEENYNGGSTGNEVIDKISTSSEDGKLLKKLIPGSKVREALSFRKSMEKQEEESDKDGFFRRLLRDSKDKEDDAEKDGFLRRLLSKEKDEELTSSSESFLKRLFRDKDGKLGDEVEEDGFFRRFFKDKSEGRRDGEPVVSKRDGEHHKHDEDDHSNGKTEEDEKDSSNRRSSKYKSEKKIDGFNDNHGEDRTNRGLTEDEKEGFFRRLFKDKNDERRDVGLGHGDERCNRSVEDDDKDGFFHKMFRDKNEEKRVVPKCEEKRAAGHVKFPNGEIGSRCTEEDEKDGFFRRMFKDKNEDKKVVAGHIRIEDEEVVSRSTDNDEKGSFFLRIFKDRSEGKRESGLERAGDEERIGKTAKDDVKDGLFHKIFKEKNEEKAVVRQDKNGYEGGVDSCAEDDEKDGFFHRIFKEKNEEKRFSGYGKYQDEERLSKSIDENDKDGFFPRIFKSKHEEKREAAHNRDDENGSKFRRNIDDADKDGFFRRLFKDKNEDRKDEGHNTKQEENQVNSNCEEEESSDFLSFRRLFRVHPEDTKNAAMNSNTGSPSDSSPGTENFFRRLFRDRDRSIEDSELFGSKRQKESRPGSPRQQNERLHAKPPLPNFLISQIRRGAYHSSLEFVQSLCDTSYGLVDIFPIEDRKVALQESLHEINSRVSVSQKCGGVCFPMGRGMYRVVHIPVDEAVLLNSREKAPYLICVEVLKSESPSQMKVALDAHKLSRGVIPLANGDVRSPKPPPWAYPLWSQHPVHHFDTDRMLNRTSQAIDQAMAQLWEDKVKFVHVSLTVEKEQASMLKDGEEHDSVSYDLKESTNDSLEKIQVSLSAIPGVNLEDVRPQEAPHRKEHRRVPSTIAIEEVKVKAASGQTPPGLPLIGAGQSSSDEQPKVANGTVHNPSDALSGELWEVKKERIRKLSPYGKLPGWDLRSVIVKSGDDCRQEHLAVQLVAHFYDIYQEAGLPLWLRPYEVLVTSSYTALIETVPDTASIHSIKSRFPNISSLRDYLVAKYEENSPSFKLVQVKDRHNGNLLMDEEGHIIHIDFGFMLSNSPGGVNFESAPFKLTRELLEVMDSDAEGNPSEFFDYFKVLCIQGFLTCRKHAEQIILLVEMLQVKRKPLGEAHGGKATARQKPAIVSSNSCVRARVSLRTLSCKCQWSCGSGASVGAQMSSIVGGIFGVKAPKLERLGQRSCDRAADLSRLQVCHPEHR